MASNLSFFKTYWEDMGEDVYTLISDAFINGYFDQNICGTLLALFPTIQPPKSIKNFWPIDLFNVTYKLITKVLVNRIRHFLDDLVRPLQSSFIPGRGNSNNAILVQEVIHHMHRSQSKQGTLIFKINLEKAYDRINWNFLKSTLEEFGFPHIIVGLIMYCVSSSEMTILWIPSFSPSRGLRQGDPLSPYLTLLINDHVRDGSWKPVHPSNSGPGISHLYLQMMSCYLPELSPLR